MQHIIIDIVQNVLGGLGIFLIGMKFMSDGMQAVAGKRLNKLVSAITDNRILAVLVGLGVTGVIQSSSATTVMVIGFVNSGIMSLMQAIGVIFGANIGTTVSMWILTLNLADYGLLIIGLSAIPFLFSKNERTHYTGMTILGLGMLFLGLMMMSDGFKPLRDMDDVKHWLTLFEATTLLGFLKSVFVGIAVTAVIQSSTAVIGIVMGLAVNGVIGFETSVAIIMGSNIGTTITAALACIGASRNAMRAALSHFLFNFIGVFFVIVFHSQFIDASRFLIEKISSHPIGPDNMKLAIACVHTGFNLICTLIMLPVMGQFAKFVTFCLPMRESETKSERYTPRYLDKRLLVQPSIAIAQAQKEVLFMGSCCIEMLDTLLAATSTSERDEELEESIFRKEDDMDIAQKEIVDYVSRLLRDNISHTDALNVSREIKQADEFESVSDYVRNALKAYLKIRNAGEDLSTEARGEIIDLNKHIREYCGRAMNVIVKPVSSEITALEEQSRTIDDLAREYRNAHMRRLAVTCTEPVKSIVYSDMLMSFRRMNDHILNIVQTMRD